LLLRVINTLAITVIVTSGNNVMKCLLIRENNPIIFQN